MNASFLQASLFTSVVAFGVAAMAAVLGILLIIIGVAIRPLRKAFNEEAVAASRVPSRG
jgi:hypothetical protein